MSFDDAFAAVLAAEGGTSNDPDDAGGLTHAGITRVTATAAHARGLVSTGDPRKLTDAEIRKIYQVFYWDRVVFSAMAEEHAHILFDDAVNCGVGTAISHLQRALNKVAASKISVDGILGPATERAYLAAMTAHEHPDLADDYMIRSFSSLLLCERVAHYMAICDGNASTPARKKQEESNRKFLRGWLTRLRKWL